MAAPRIRLKSGDHRTVRLQVVQQGGNAPENLAGASLRMEVASYVSAAPVIIKSTEPGGGMSVVGDPANGIVDIELVPEDTESIAGIFVFEIEMVDSVGKIRTLNFGSEDAPEYQATLWVQEDLILAASV